MVAPDHEPAGYLGYTLTGDSVYYHWQANALADGHWFVDPFLWMNRGEGVASAAHPPLYSALPRPLVALGIDTVTGHRLASSLLGIAAVAVIGLLGYRLAGPAAGLVAAGIAAVYPQLWINDGMLLSESIAVLAIVVALHTMYSFWQRPTLRNAVCSGASCGVAALVANELLLLFPVVAIPLAARGRATSTGAPRIRAGVVGCVAGGLVIAPWASVQPHPLRGADAHVVVARERAVGRELRPRLLRRPHRLLRQLLRGPVAEPG